jgi:hypothetical protein
VVFFREFLEALIKGPGVAADDVIEGVKTISPSYFLPF